MDAPFSNDAPAPARHLVVMQSAATLLPGIVLTAVIAAASFALRTLPGIGLFSPMILAIGIGMLLHNVVGTPRRAVAGVKFTMRRILRFAIVLLGLQLTFGQVAEVGVAGVAVIAVTLVSTFTFTKWAGARLGVERRLAELIAAGTSICGASAVIATNTVTEAHDEDVAYAVACVTVFGSIAMFVYPLIGGLMQMPAESFGLWAGSSIHEVAQVVAAAYQRGKEAGDFATIAKLTRVMMLAPLVFALGMLRMNIFCRASSSQNRFPLLGKCSGGHVRGRKHAAPLPWFVFGFIAMIGVASVVTLPPTVKTPIVTSTTFMLSMALAAMGLETDVRKLKAAGLRPMLLGLIAFLFVACFSFCLVRIAI